jgi:hypothetical protein
MLSLSELNFSGEARIRTSPAALTSAAPMDEDAAPVFAFQAERGWSPLSL